MCSNCWPVVLKYRWLIACYLEALLWKIYTKLFPNSPFLQFMLLHDDCSLVSDFDVKRRYKMDRFFVTSHKKSCAISQFLLPLSKPKNEVLSVHSIWRTVLSVKNPLLVTRVERQILSQHWGIRVSWLCQMTGIQSFSVSM